jgi:alanine dehydrogenase
MTPEISFGFPKIHAEPGEKRAFLPDFIDRIAKRGISVILEEGYGKEMGYSEAAYKLKGNGKVRFGSLQDVYQQKYVMVLRCPSDQRLKLLQSGSCLISMIHYPTRPGRVELLNSLGVEAISLDSLKDDSGRRLVENLRAVGWNGMEAAIGLLQTLHPEFENPERDPIQVTLLGAGAVGSHVVQAAIRYSNEVLRKDLYDKHVPGVRVNVVDYDLSGHEKFMRKILMATDILVDATQRPDTSKPVIPNAWLTELPTHAVLLDLSVDPYQCEHTPSLVKGIEGIPQGNLDHYIFHPDDPAYQQIPPCVDKTNRRWAVSCYSWPGIYPVECMEVYGRQLRPIIRRLLDVGGIEQINPQGRFFERAISRAMLSRWQSSPGTSIMG